MTKKRMFLIDAMAMAFRNFHAFGARPLTTPEGVPISAVFGSAVYLLKLIQEEKPDYLVVLSDSKEKTFRHDLFPEYKANRTEMPEDLAVQLPYFRSLFEHLLVPYLAMPGFEADDLIGTMASKYSSSALEIYIVSGDKDFMQLVTDNVFLYSPKKGGESEIVGMAGVFEKFGVKPEQVIDALAIIGDTADNLPGISGIGPKGAAKLLEKFSSLDDIYANIGDLPANRQREALVAGKDRAYLARRLLTICLDCPLPFESLEMLRFDPAATFHNSGLTSFFEDLAFNRLKSQVEKLREKYPRPDGSQAELILPSTQDPSRHYRLVTSLPDLDAVLEKINQAGRFAFDTETTGLSLVSDRPIGMSLAWDDGEAAYIPFYEGHTQLKFEDLRRRLLPVLTDPALLKIAHNAKFDIGMLANIGLEPAQPIHDTYLMSYLLNPVHKGHGLDELSLQRLGIRKIPTSSLIGKGAAASMTDVPLDLLSEYACEDVDCTLRLYPLLRPELERQEVFPVATDIEFPLTPVLGVMEKAGIFVDSGQLLELSGALGEDLAKLEAEIHGLAGEVFNVNSPKQLQVILFEKLKVHEALKIKTLKKTKSGYSTDVSILERLAEHPLPNRILEYRTLAKLKNTYVDVLPTLINPASGRVHTHFNQTGASTGRLSSTDPNLQNIPIRSSVGRMIREAFKGSGPDQVILSADYSQIELRLLAEMASETGLIVAFRQGADIHTSTAARVFGVEPGQVDANMRARAKAINFGIIYGMGAAKLSKEIKVSFSEAREFIDRYFRTYPRIKEFAEECKSFARAHGYSRTITGRRRPIPEFQSDNPAINASAENIAVNAPIQGSAADLIKLAMIQIAGELAARAQLRARMLLQVHDELVFECHRDDSSELSALVEKCMAGAMPLSVPLKVDVGIGENWLEAH